MQLLFSFPIDIVLVGSLDEGDHNQGDRKSHLDLVMKGRRLVAKRYLVIVLPLDLLTNQLAESRSHL